MVILFVLDEAPRERSLRAPPAAVQEPLLNQSESLAHSRSMADTGGDSKSDEGDSGPHNDDSAGAFLRAVVTESLVVPTTIIMLLEASSCLCLRDCPACVA